MYSEHGAGFTENEGAGLKDKESFFLAQRIDKK